ncbi:MAG: type I DNA topoisomerase [Candidatus Paceibacterota bacterium]|jgi:DNA topoisomerase-1|nr:type I DNA topoisomerase [Candidatus Paceibacterota bacterium]
MKLLIVESPSKAKTISKYLGGEFKVVASVGHIRDIPKSSKNAIDIPGGFIPHYEISKGKEKVVAEIQDLADRADEVLLATDPDREGEAIAWHIAEAVGLKKAKRVAFHEITENAIKEAIKHPRGIDQDLRKAQEARRVLDRLVGYGLSGLLWKKLRYGLGAGRVQSPALRLLVEKEQEIRAFIPEDFWVITAETETKKKERILLECSEKPKDKKTVDEILAKAKKEKWKIVDVKETQAKRSPRPPFTTSTLQQAASTQLGFSPSKTMGVAQKLYEAGHITYMRTDSTNLGAEAIEEISKTIAKLFGKDQLEVRTYKTKSKNAQEAHEAIRPTHSAKKDAGLTGEQKDLYALIWKRTIASQMADASILRTKIIANTESESIPAFSVNGSRLLTPGWLAADPKAREDDVELPKIAAGDPLSLIDIKDEAKQTEPPNRYSEAGLVKKLEELGIGRPSTYASIIKTNIDHGYVEKEGKALRPTDTGEVVIDKFLKPHFGEFISDTFTAEMEEDLDEIADGTREYEKTLRDFYTPFAKQLKAKEKIDKITNVGDAPKEMRCPICGGDMVIKLGKNGSFLSCAKFPECNGARMLDGRELEGPKMLDEKCPKCGGALMERDGRFGKFISCSNYPKCKFIKADPAEEAKKMTGVKCGKCADGEMMERRGRFGIFYSCSNYPECKHIIKSKPTGNLCPLCGELMMEGTKTIPERCSVKTCPNHNPHKLQDENRK